MNVTTRPTSFSDLATNLRLLSQLPGARVIPVRSGRVRIGTVVYFQADRAAYAYSRESVLIGHHSWCRDAIENVLEHWRALA